MNVTEDDKRLIAPCAELGAMTIFAERTSEKKWHYCKYCYRDVPTFVLEEATRVNGLTPGIGPTLAQVLRCCWECGSGIEILWSELGSGTYAEWPQSGVAHSGLARVTSVSSIAMPATGHPT